MRNMVVCCWLVVLVLAAGCAVPNTTPTATRNLLSEVPVDAPPGDGAEDGATEAATDVAADQVPPDMVIADAADVLPGETGVDVSADEVDVTADVGSDAGDVPLSDSPDVAIEDVLPDTGTDVFADVPPDVAIDARPDVPLDVGIDTGSDAPPGDMGTDVFADVPTDTSPDTACPSGMTRCGVDCVDLTSDNSNCGTCGTVCPAGRMVCTRGTCQIACGPGETECSGDCVTLANNASHCGGCGMTCPTRANATPTCASSACGLACNTGYGNCDGNATNGCEADLATNAMHCGACGRACASGYCAAGVCLLTPVVDLNFRNTGINGVWVRSASDSGGSPRGVWAYQPCVAGTSTRVCRVDLRALVEPGSETVRVTEWYPGWGLEVIPMRDRVTPFCPSGSSCGTCGAGTAFSTTCLETVCVMTGPGGFVLQRYEQLYDTVLPPGVSFGTTPYYGLHLGMNGRGWMLCARPPA